MKATANKQSFFVFVLFTLGFALLYYSFVYSSQNLKNPLSTPTDTTFEITAETESVSKPAENSDSKVAYIEILNGSNHNILKLDLGSNDRKVVYTDNNDKLKLIAALGMDADNKIIALLGTDLGSFNGELVTISTDGKGTITNLIKNFGSSIKPSIFQDYILTGDYQNNEPAGYNIYVQKLDGSNKRQIGGGISSLIDPILVSSDSFSYLTLDNKSKYNLITINNSKISSTITLEGKILQHVLGTGYNLITSTNEDKNNLTYTISKLVKDVPSKLFDSEKSISNLVIKSSNIYYTENNNTKSNGQIIKLENDSKTTIIGEGQYLIGFEQ